MAIRRKYKKQKSSKVSGEDLENSLILAYRLDDFIKTQLFQSLTVWQQENPKFHIQKA